MNIDFEAALRYIDLEAYDKAVASINKAITTEEENLNESIAIEYRCVLGELLINLERVDEARTEFEKVISYCNETHLLVKQRKIAQTYLDALDGRLPMPKREAPAKLPGHAPLVPKPIQDKAFISRQMNKKRR